MNIRRTGAQVLLLTGCGLMACAPSSDGSGGGTGGSKADGSGGAAIASTGGSSASTGGVGSGGSGDGSGAAGSGGTSVGASGGAAVGTGGTSAASGGSTGSGGAASGTGGGGRGGSGAGQTGGVGGGGTAQGGGGQGGWASTGAGGGVGCGTASGLYICEDFESATVGSKTVAGWTSTGSISVASDKAHSGTRSLKIGAALNGERTIRRTTNLAGGAISTTHWGRVFYMMDKLQNPSDFVHSTHVFGDGNVSAGKVQVRVFDTILQSNGTSKFGYNVQESYGSNAEHGVFTNPDYKYPTVWTCTEWHLDATAKSYHFYQDGNEIKPIGFANASAYGRDPEIPTTFSSFGVGWNNYQSAPSPGYVAWFDDIAVGPDRIGCN